MELLYGRGKKLTKTELEELADMGLQIKKTGGKLKLDKEDVIKALDWHFKSYTGTAGSTIVTPKRRRTSNQ